MWFFFSYLLTLFSIVLNLGLLYLWMIIGGMWVSPHNTASTALATPDQIIIGINPNTKQIA